MGKQWKQCQTLFFFGSKITANGDCSHEIKRHLLLGRKVMTNLDSILKSRDITLPTMVHLVKAMVCPVVMYGCESWTVKKAEHEKIDAFEVWCWRKLLRVLWTARRTKHARPPCPPLTPRACSNSCPSSQWCHPTNLILCCPLLLLPYIFPSIGVFFNESVLHIRWPKYWSFSFSISPSNESSGPISFRMDWFNLLAVQGSLKSLLQHHSSEASVLQCSAFFMVQLSHPYTWELETVGNLVRKCNFFLHVRKQKEIWIEMVYWVSKYKTEVVSKIVNWTNRYRSSCHPLSKNPLSLSLHSGSPSATLVNHSLGDSLHLTDYHCW